MEKIVCKKGNPTITSPKRKELPREFSNADAQEFKI
jgi:hypothetical protein